MAKGLKKSEKMDSKKIQELIESAKDAVSNEKDESFKIESFKIIFNKLLENQLFVTSPAHSEKTIQKNDMPIIEKQNELAKLCSITLEELMDVFKFRENTVEIIVPIIGNDAFKRLIGSQCYLAAAEIVFDKEWIESKELTECMRSMGVKDLANMAPTLKKLSDIFRSSGSRGHNKYKLTSGFGRKSAFELIKKLAKGESLVEN